MHFGEFNLRDTIFARTNAFDFGCRRLLVVRCPADRWPDFPIGKPA